ncbi:mechanosensitive ion channel family protein [Klugiella xanthotipulae]|uniref:Small conductance mechanosensitive channel n=1 Tax=Klugiella xanthotipulae TaxID=244735 RepID=A0A543HT51_9MICO|nr:mechanosensitive ion channel family protein [Klugiella xanthotipulae]TQM61439.1 small conductance mechanosensitive channel [Klugiella xanthotipulae]
MTADDIWTNLVSFYETYRAPIQIIMIIVFAVVIRAILLTAVRKLVSQIVTGAKKSQNTDDTQALISSPLVAARIVQRTRTLGSVSNNIITITVAVVSLILVLDQMHFQLTALLASAGIVAAGLAFGAQNIVKDILNGLFMVFEDQLGVGDVVDIGDVTGRVEAVGIRITQVRDVTGTLWFIRNGEIVRVGNRSHDWSRAILDLAISADADIDLAKQLIQDTADRVVQEPRIAARVLEQPLVWGVEYLTGETVLVRLVVKTRSGSQWEIARVLREKIKSDLDANGITLSATVPAASPFSGVDGPANPRHKPSSPPRRKDGRK